MLEPIETVNVVASEHLTALVQANCAKGDAAPPQVLIVDRSSESIQVLQAILRRRGVASIGANRFGAGLELARQASPQVIVLDEDSIPEGEGRICEQYASATAANNASLVFLGNLPNRVKSPNSEVISKPYHYSDLIRRIEGLLEIKRAA